jgi:hypothetical protein
MLTPALARNLLRRWREVREVAVLVRVGRHALRAPDASRLALLLDAPAAARRACPSVMPRPTAVCARHCVVLD